MGLDFGKNQSEVGTEEERLQNAEEKIHKDTEKIKNVNAKLSAFLDQAKGDTSSMDKKMEETVQQRKDAARERDDQRIQEIREYLNGGAPSEQVMLRKAESDVIGTMKKETGTGSSSATPNSQNSTESAPEEDGPGESFKNRPRSNAETERLQNAEKNIHKDTERIRSNNATLKAFLAVNKLFGEKAANNFRDDLREWEQSKNSANISAEEITAWCNTKIAEIAKNLQDSVYQYLETGSLKNE